MEGFHEASNFNLARQREAEINRYIGGMLLQGLRKDPWRDLMLRQDSGIGGKIKKVLMGRGLKGLGIN
jgi:hypothetical protein